MRGKVIVLAAAAAALYASHGAPGTAAAPSAAAAKAVAYAQQQIGKPYLWAAAGPGAFDCSGLVYEAYGASIARTSQDQWATETHVSQPAAGDLVFFAGSDGTDTSPGHVGIVTDPATHTMIDAYATGTAVRSETYGLSTSGPGLASPVGYTDPAGGGA